MNYGILAPTKQLSVRESPGTATGQVRTFGAIKFQEKTDRIPARLGLRFGVEHVFRNIPSDGMLEVLVTHPPIARPSGEVVTLSRAAKNPSDSGTSYRFDRAAELLPGKWVFEFKYRGQLLCQKTFSVVTQLSATDLMAIAEGLQWGDAWDRVVENALERYLQRYKEGALANVEFAARERALGEIYRVMKPQVSWKAMREVVAPSIVGDCDPNVLDRMMALKSAAEPATPDEQLAREYATCILSGIKKLLPVLMERVLSAAPRVDEIIKEYNPDYKRGGSDF